MPKQKTDPLVDAVCRKEQYYWTENYKIGGRAEII